MSTGGMIYLASIVTAFITFAAVLFTVDWLERRRKRQRVLTTSRSSVSTPVNA